MEETLGIPIKAGSGPLEPGKENWSCIGTGTKRQNSPNLFVSPRPKDSSLQPCLSLSGLGVWRPLFFPLMGCLVEFQSDNSCWELEYIYWFPQWTELIFWVPYVHSLRVLIVCFFLVMPFPTINAFQSLQTLPTPNWLQNRERSALSFCGVRGECFGKEQWAWNKGWVPHCNLGPAS